MGKLDTTDDGEGDESVEDGHKAGDAEDEECGGGADAGSHDLGYGEVSLGFGDGNGGNRLHGLDRHRDTEEEAGEDVVDGSEDEGGAHIKMVDKGEGQHYGDVGAQITHRSSQLRPYGGLEAKAGGEGGEAVAPLPPPPPVMEEGGCFRRG